MITRFTIAMTLAGAVLLTGCEHVGIGVTSVGEITRNPASFEGKEVRMKGVVREITQIPIVDLRSYVFFDGTGDITVTTKSGLPAKGDKLVVRGKVANLAVIGGKSFGVTVAELERSATF